MFVSLRPCLLLLLLLTMNSALLYAAQTNTERLAATTRAECRVVIEGVILYFIFRWTSSCDCKVLPLFAPRSISPGFHQRVFFFHCDGATFTRYFLQMHTADPPNLLLLQTDSSCLFFFIFSFFVKNALGLWGNAVTGAVSYGSRRQQPLRRKWARLLLASFERQVHAGHWQQFASHLLGRTGPGITSPQEFREKVLEISKKGSPSELVLSRRIIYSTPKSNLR